MRVAPLVLVAGLLGFPALGQEVTLPLDRFEALRARSLPSPAPSPRPPAPFALESADLEIATTPDSARISQRLTLSLFDAEWQTIALPAAGSLTATALGDAEGRVTASNTDWTLVVRGIGRHQVRLDSVLPLQEDASATRATRQLSLPLPPAALVAGAIRPGTDVEEVRIGAGGLARGAFTRGALLFVGAPGARLEAQLLGRALLPTRARLPLKFRASAATLATLSRTRLKARALVTATVQQGQLERLRLRLPTGLEVVSVSGASWDMEDGVLVAQPGAPMEHALELSIELSGEPPTGSFDAPLLVPQDAASITLLSSLVVEAGGLPQLDAAGSSREPDASDLEALPTEFRTRTTFVVRDQKQPPRWSVEWPEGAKVLAIQADRLLVDTVWGEAGRAAWQCWVVVRSSGALQLDVRPPAGFELQAASRDGTPVTPGTSSKGLSIPLVSGPQAQTIHLVGLLPIAPLPAEGTLEVPLPALSAPATRAELRVSLPGSRSYALAQTGYAGRVTPPPGPRAAPATANALYSLLQSKVTRRPSTEEAAWFKVPAGYAGLEAAWNALSNAPAPVLVTVKPRRQKEEWF